MSFRTRSVALLLLLAVAACGDDDGAATTVTTAGDVGTTTTTGAPATAELRFTFDAVTGVEGKVLVATVFGDGEIAGTVCLPADSDPFSGTALVMTSEPDNPCGHDAPFGVLLTTEGDFSYFVAAYTPGTQVTEVCAQGDVTVEGSTEVVIAASDLSSANCTG